MQRCMRFVAVLLLRICGACLNVQNQSERTVEVKDCSWHIPFVHKQHIKFIRSSQTILEGDPHVQLV